jgi:hypothetical protein
MLLKSALSKEVMKNQTAAKLDALQAEVDALKRLQAETAVNNMGQAAAELNAFPPSPRLRRTGLPAILDKDIRTGIDSTS